MNKKYLLSVIILSVFFVLPIFASAQTANLQIGVSGAAVTNLQNILKSDPSIYPQGLVTGFFGPATQAAIKNLQAKYGLPQTGIVDSATLQVIFPSNVQLKVVSPNGGESWDKSVNHSVTWQVTIGPVVVNGQQLTPATSSSPGNITTSPSIAPFFDNVSIDLIKDSDSSFRYHIGTANLYQTQFSWQIPTSISDESDYRVQISTGGVVPCMTGMGVMCPNYFPQYSFTDTSDNTFSITGNNTNNNTKAQLNALLDQFQQQINALQSELQSMRQLVSSL
ncbi:MAG: peptidoglycan-binding protein [Candidatus Staskawiczbacteria bacterium]|jgi:hypothetical protein